MTILPPTQFKSFQQRKRETEEFFSVAVSILKINEIEQSNGESSKGKPGEIVCDGSAGWNGLC